MPALVGGAVLEGKVTQGHFAATIGQGEHLAVGTPARAGRSVELAGKRQAFFRMQIPQAPSAWFFAWKDRLRQQVPGSQRGMRNRVELEILQPLGVVRQGSHGMKGLPRSEE